jgi:hypothetical protein
VEAAEEEPLPEVLPPWKRRRKKLKKRPRRLPVVEDCSVTTEELEEITRFDRFQPP